VVENSKYMIQNYEKDCHLLNKILQKIVDRKRYIKELKNKAKILRKIWHKNHKIFNTKIHLRKNTNFLITYVIEIYFAKTNTFLQVTNSLGQLKFFCSAGFLLFKGKNKKARTPVLKKIITILLNKLTFLKDRPAALHLKNVGFKKNWILKKLEKKVFLKTVTGFSSYSHNGCRKKKVRRKK